MRWVMTRVLPEPAPARTRRGPLAVGDRLALRRVQTTGHPCGAEQAIISDGERSRPTGGIVSAPTRSAPSSAPCASSAKPDSRFQRTIDRLLGDRQLRNDQGLPRRLPHHGRPADLRHRRLGQIPRDRRYRPCATSWSTCGSSAATRFPLGRRRHSERLAEIPLRRRLPNRPQPRGRRRRAPPRRPRRPRAPRPRR